jgi:hypothetical protein
MLNVYPNPALDFLFLFENLMQTESKIFIRSIDGKLIKSTFVNKGDRKIDVQELHSGIYILEITNKFYKFIKE